MVDQDTEEDFMAWNGKEAWREGFVKTAVGEIPLINTALRGRDRLQSVLVRLGFGRDNYRVHPGFYGVGSPDGESPVLVTSNYKLTLDSLRKELENISCWILVLDTHGINVWCAAGKRTFSTAEIVSRVAETRLEEVVGHRTLVLPQLGASGVSAEAVREKTGFRVIYGPVRAHDIPAFLGNKMKKDESMRTVRFTLKDRFVLIPVELVLALLVLAAGFVLVVAADWIARGAFDLRSAFIDFVPFLAAVLTGCVVVPLLLPYIPVRSFAIKGLIAGIVLAAAINLAYRPSLVDGVTTSVLILSTSSLFALFCGQGWLHGVRRLSKQLPGRGNPGGVRYRWRDAGAGGDD
jgi:hypothetical protein